MRFMMIAVGLASCSPPAVEEQPDDVARASCASPPPYSLDAETTEAQGDFDSDLAALELGALPETLPPPSSPLARELVAYMLETPPLALTELSRDALTSNFGKSILGFYALDEDFSFLRRGLFRFYACERGQPLSLADALSRIELDEPELIERSEPKGVPRTLTHGVRADGVDVFVAETANETEMLIHGHRSDDAVDFFVWDASGNAVRSSTFATTTGNTIEAAAPYTCVACHRDRVNGTGFTVIRPTTRE